MFIRLVDEGLERLVRDRLPLPQDLGDVSFDAPSSNWSAQLSRITVNFFLYDVARSNEPARSLPRRDLPDGRAQRRLPLPTVQLGYLVSAWAGSPRDEHQLLGDVISTIAGLTTLPEEYLPSPPASTVHLNFAEDPGNRPREIIGGSGGQLKAAFTLLVSLAADTFEWEAEAPRVERVQALTGPIPRNGRPMS
jgi:hypothetical protein